MRSNNIIDKDLYKFTIYILKILPMIMSFSYLVMFLLFNYAERYVIIPHIIGTVIAPLLFLYLTSYVFKFCFYHRIFLHYYAFISILNVFDHYICIPLSTGVITFIHDSITILFLITVIFLYYKKFLKKKPLDLN
jgi:hypothetical protein